MGSVKYVENLADTIIAKTTGQGSGTEVNLRYLA